MTLAALCLWLGLAAGAGAGDAQAAREDAEVLALVDALAASSEGAEDALARVPARRLVPALERAAAGADDARRALLLELVGRHGEARDALALLAIARSGPADPAALERALGALIEREPAALDLLEGAWRSASEPIALAIVRAAGGSRRGRAMAVLVDALGRDGELDGGVLAEIARLARACDPATAAKAARAVEDALAHGAPALARPAVDALGRLADPGSVPLLVACLAHEDRGLARTAHAALVRATGLAMRAEPEPWSAWLAAEERWLARGLDAALDGLRADDPARVHAALREIAAHPLERHLLAREVAHLLQRAEPELRAAGCDALARLGSRAALSDLVPALDDEPAVAAAAHAALGRLTGLALPPDREAWDAALEQIAAGGRAPAGPIGPG